VFASFDRLNRDVDVLRDYIAFLTQSVEVGRLEIGKRLKMAEHVKGLQEAHNKLADAAALQELNYSSAVISLYAAVERFGEGSLADYVQFLNAVCPSYGQLPEQLRNAHLDATVRLMQSPELDRLSSAEELVADLNSCIQNEQPYRLTPATFAFHTANFRLKLFDQLWNQVGVENLSQGIAESEAYIEAVEAVDPGSPKGSFFRLDDIAERRNEIAHGVEISELLSLPLLLQYVDVVEAFAAALWSRVMSAALGVLAQHYGRSYGQPLAVYNNEIVCVRCSEGQLGVGDLLIGKRPDGSFRGGSIVDMQVNDEDVLQIDASSESIDVGVKVGFHAKENDLFWSLPQDGDIGALWQKDLLE
jgi:hypothetical protein